VKAIYTTGNTITAKVECDADSNLKEGWILVDTDPVIGEKVEWYNDKWERYSDEYLVRAKLRKDNRGIWLNPKDPFDSQVINELDILPHKGWIQTTAKPLVGVEHQRYDVKSNQWVEDTSTKKYHESIIRLADIKRKIEESDWKIIKCMRLNKTLEELYPGERRWYMDQMKEYKYHEQIIKDFEDGRK
jgi:hypothetical protein